MGKYWRIDEGKGWVFHPPQSTLRLYRHTQTPIRRHVKVQGVRSPYDGEWVYWSARLGRSAAVELRETRLLNRQQGRCRECDLFFMDGERLEVDHRVPKVRGGPGVLSGVGI
jgi:RNA-directed DNA polymerase